MLCMRMIETPMARDKYSYFVQILKLTFVTIFLCNVILVFAFIKFGNFQSIRLEESDEKAKSKDLTIISSPSFFGLDKKGHKYTLHSNKATQVNANQYQLVDVQGKYFLDQTEQEYVSVSASLSYADLSVKNIDLIGDVEVNFSGGYRLLTDQALVNFDTALVSSEKLATITGDKGKIVAKSGFLLAYNKSLVDFFGPVTTLLYDQEGQHTEIDSDSLQVDYALMNAMFSGNVVIKRSDIEIRCVQARVYSVEHNGHYKIDHIDFIDDVTIIQNGRIAKGSFAQYNAKGNNITMEHSVSLTGHGNYVEGDKFTYTMDNKVARMIGQDHRVRVVITDQK